MRAASHSTPIRDHPRVCGEHFVAMGCAPVGVGSSPRVRGAFDAIVKNGYLVRIIPACAGSILGKRCFDLRFSDHPRVCGEHPRTRQRHEAFSGSSPRVRGAFH